MRKKRFDIIPHVGAGDIKLGMPREIIREILGEPEYSSEKSVLDYGDFSIPVPAKDGFLENEIQITFDDNNKADFIEFSGRGAKYTDVFLKEIEVFKTPASILIKEITRLTLAEFDKEENEIPYTYVFPEIDLSVWRQVVPELDETIEEIPESDDGKYFWTIGIGVKGYYTT